MELILKRELIFPDAIHGKIYYRDKPVCCTLENPRAYVPAGKYQIKMVQEKGEKEYLTPYLYREDAHHHTCTITKGNGVCNLLTFVIYAGKYQCRGLVIQGDKYLKRLNELIATGKEKVYLKIESQQVNESTSSFLFLSHEGKNKKQKESSPAALPGLKFVRMG